jgi:hypothetical protein
LGAAGGAVHGGVHGVPPGQPHGGASSAPQGILMPAARQLLPALELLSFGSFDASGREPTWLGVVRGRCPLCSTADF